LKSMPHLFPTIVLLLPAAKLYTYFLSNKRSIRKYSEPVLFIYFSPDNQTLWWCCCPGSQSGRTYTTRTNNLFSLLLCAFSAFIYLLLFLDFPFLSFAVVGVIWRNITKNKQNSGCKEFLLLSSYNIHIQFFLSPNFF
jgi:hypothetical protein